MTAAIRQPIFLIGAPGAGGGLLLSSLARAEQMWHAPADSDPFAFALSPESHGLTAADAAGREAETQAALAAVLHDRELRPLDGATAELAVGWSPRAALRVPFLAAAFPASYFVLCSREPSATLTQMLAMWRSEQRVSARELPSWEGPPWSLPLIPGWRALSGRPLAEIVVGQWHSLTEAALDGLTALAPERWAIVDYDTLLAHPRPELRRLCEFLGVRYDQALLAPVEEEGRRVPESAPTPAEIEPLLEQTRALRERIDSLRAPAPESPTSPRNPRPADGSPFRSSFSGGFARRLSQLHSSLLVSTYQSGRLICARTRGGMLNTHLRSFDKPMGIAAARDRFALGTRTEVWDFRDLPAAAPKLDPPGVHDACFLPRNRHTTGDILIHELAYAEDGELWGVATAFSCLVTFDADSSFRAGWRPPFVTELVPEDRCHLNGLCLRDGRPAYVTALGRSDTPSGWRAGKAEGGVLLEIGTGEILAGGLSMPHSPRWHDGRLWLLESGRGELVTVDLQSGTTETVVELPGFTRGLALAGGLAFVGLSQIRESSTFGDLPLTERLDERMCGVWAVDLHTGDIAGWLRFEDFVQEIFDVALLPGARYPEIAEPGSSAVAGSFALG